MAIAISTDIYDKLDNVGRVGGIVGMTDLVLWAICYLIADSILKAPQSVVLFSSLLVDLTRSFGCKN